MFNQRMFALAIGLPVALAAHTASAVVIAGSSTGTFTAPTTCASGQVCGVDNSGAVAKGELYWGGTENGNSGRYARDPGGATSTLNGGTTTITGNTPQTGVIIGSLTYYNGAAAAASSPTTFTSTYNLAVSFTLPGVSSDPTNQFALTIDQTTNGAGGGTPDTISGFTMSDLQGISIALPGVTVSNFRYVCTSGCGASASFNAATNTFTNAEGHTATLSIEADFTNSVPEPASLALLGIGLVGIGARRLSRRG